MQCWFSRTMFSCRYKQKEIDREKYTTKRERDRDVEYIKREIAREKKELSKSARVQRS